MTQQGKPNNVFSSKEYIKLIKECEKSGVSEFVLGDFRVSFTKKAAPPDEIMHIPGEKVIPTAEDELEDLMLTDPVAYEERMWKDLETESGRA